MKNCEKKQLLTIQELAKYLRVSKGTIYKHVSAGEFPRIKVFGRTFFDLAVVNDWLAQQSITGPVEKKPRYGLGHRLGRRDRNKPVVFSLN
jgi:excisionase family DNA binding protein